MMCNRLRASCTPNLPNAPSLGFRRRRKPARGSGGGVQGGYVGLVGRCEPALPRVLPRVWPCWVWRV
eukprot:15435224-Alexandrium_andersonii.AAC.1